MSLALNVIFEKRVRHQFVGDLGVPLLNEFEALAELACEAGATPLDAFGGYAHVEIPLDYEGDPRDLWASEDPHWFDPADALTTVETLIQAVETYPGRMTSESPDGIAESLAELAEALRAGVAAGSRFHFDAF